MYVEEIIFGYIGLNEASQVAVVVKDPPDNAGKIRDLGSIPGLGRSPEKEMQPTPLFFAGESHRQRSLAGYSPWGHTRLKQLGTQGLNEILFLVIPHGLQDLNPPTWDLNLGHSRESAKS